jgi:hypothetical protein
MEKEQPLASERVQITKAIYDGLEFIRNSGVTNMLDRPTVLSLAREWDFIATADWIESVDTGTYGRLIVQGPDIIDEDLINGANESEPSRLATENESSSQFVENDAVNQTSEVDLTDMAMDHVRGNMHDLIASLGKHATLTIADTYLTEQMGVVVTSSRRDFIQAERTALIRNLGQVSSLWLQLDATMIEVQRGVGSLQYLIDPENN